MNLSDKLLVIFGSIGLICSLAFFVSGLVIILFASTFNSLNISACVKLGTILLLTAGPSVIAIMIGILNLRRR